MGLSHTWEKGEIHAYILAANLKEGAGLEDQDVDGRIILRWVSEE